jgi:hypothetical protein
LRGVDTQSLHAPIRTLLVRMRVRCLGMLVGELAVLLCSLRVVLCLLVLAHRVVMIGLVVVMRSGVVVTGRAVVMLGRWMFSHLNVLPLFRIGSNQIVRNSPVSRGIAAQTCAILASWQQAVRAIEQDRYQNKPTPIRRAAFASSRSMEPMDP